MTIESFFLRLSGTFLVLLLVALIALLVASPVNEQEHDNVLLKRLAANIELAAMWYGASTVLSFAAYLLIVLWS